MRRKIAGVALLALATVQGCKTGYNRTYPRAVDENPPDCATSPANSNVDGQTLKVFNLVAGLTCASKDYSDGYLVGQSLGYGNQLNNPGNLAVDDPNNHSYERLVAGFDTVTGHTPAVVAIDYEGDRLYSETDLLNANEQLLEHWNAGGLVSVTWRPISPWVNDFSSISANPGSLEDTLYRANSDIDLADLLDDSTAVYQVWQNKLAAMAVALKDLQEKGVTVLWRPLPEMNNNTYWWGTAAIDSEGNENGADLYTQLWVQMFEYFEAEELNNLLWVYSPGESNGDYNVSWAYPGDEYVDVVAGIARNDALSIADYSALVELGRPVAMAEYSPDPTGILTTSGLGTERGHFDNTTYADRLQGSYPSVAYWVNNHSSLLPEEEGILPGTRSNLALVDNQRSKDLMLRNYVISAEKMVEEKLRD